MSGVDGSQAIHLSLPVQGGSSPNLSCPRHPINYHLHRAASGIDNLRGARRLFRCPSRAPPHPPLAHFPLLLHTTGRALPRVPRARVTPQSSNLLCTSFGRCEGLSRVTGAEGRRRQAHTHPPFPRCRTRIASRPPTSRSHSARAARTRPPLPP